MNNTLQLYIDKEKEIKGYPITSPDRVVDENGISIKNLINDIYINVKQFGAKGDGITDDTKSIQEGIDYCSTNSKILFFPFGVYNVTTLLLKNGVKGYTSKGATLKAISKAGEGVLACNMSDRIENCFIEKFTIDCNGLGRRGIFINGNNIKISDNYIYGLDNPVNSEQGIRLYKNSCNNIIENNKILMGVDNPFGKFPSLTGIHAVGGSVNIYAGLDNNDEVIPATNKCDNNIIKNNTVINGTHGISISGADYNIISNNILKNQSHRNIILSPLASYNSVVNNQCSEFGSAGIHLAYGSCDNLIQGNNIISNGTIMISDSGGEGAIQSYVHSKNNRIIGNNIKTKSTRYGIYSAIYCNGIVIEGNIIEGGKRSLIAIESDWSSSLTELEKFGRPNYIEPINPLWGSWGNGKSFDYVTIKNNILQRLTLGSLCCGIYIAQCKETELNNLIIDGNVINSLDNSCEDFYCYVKDENKFNDSIIKNNTIAPLEFLHIVFTNKNIKLIDYTNNNWNNKAFVIADEDITKLDLSKSDFIHLNPSCDIQDIEGLMIQSVNFTTRLINIRLNNGAKIRNNTNKIRLKDGADVVGTNANQIITFMIIHDKLFEVSRNF